MAHRAVTRWTVGNRPHTGSPFDASSRKPPPPNPGPPPPTPAHPLARPTGACDDDELTGSREGGRWPGSTTEAHMSNPPRDAGSIFGKARELPPAERPAYLDRACAGDPAARAEVERLLAAPPPAAATATAPSGAVGTADYAPGGAAGEVIAGRYALLGPIGEGGMGEVWVARQTEPVQRKVAVKLIKAGMDSKSVLARFEAERQALALMDHPNIARVFDGGLTDRGRPFFVMELVDGQPLTRFCDQAKLTPRERLGLFVPVCQAVQ